MIQLLINSKYNEMLMLYYFTTATNVAMATMPNCRIQVGLARR